MPLSPNNPNPVTGPDAFALLALSDAEVVRTLGLLPRSAVTRRAAAYADATRQWRRSLARKVAPPTAETVRPGRLAHRPLVSVIVPVYNVRPYLAECLSSILSQTLTDLELICVDDGSTDGSAEILASADPGDPRIIVLRQQNHGLSQARNTGASAASGRYLYFLDSDDSIEPHALQRLYDFATSRRLEVACCDARMVLESATLLEQWGRDESYYRRSGEHPEVEDGLSHLARLMKAHEYRTQVSLQLIRRDYFLTNELWFVPGILHEDEAYTLSALALAKRVGHIADPLFLRRIRANSITTVPAAFDNAYGCFVSARQLATRFADHPGNTGLISGYVNRLLERTREQYAGLGHEQQSLVTALPQPQALLFQALIPPSETPHPIPALAVDARAEPTQRLVSLRDLICRELEPLIGSDCVLLNVPYHANIGDSLIWQGELDFLARLGVAPRYWSSTEDFDPTQIGPGSTILLQGGGNFGDLWRGNQDFRLSVTQAFPDNPIVMFPQSLHYQDRRRLESDADILNRHPDVTLCWREDRSFAIAQRFFGRCHSLLVPDMALCIDTTLLRQWERATVAGSSVFVRRLDQEFRSGEPYGVVPAAATVSDWPGFDPPDPMGVRARRLARERNDAAGPYAFDVLRPHLLQVGVEFLSQYETVYSTRLHAAILGILLGKDVRLFRNSYAKNQAVYETWLRGMDHLTLVRG